MNRFIYSAGFILIFFATAVSATTAPVPLSPGTGSLSGKITEQGGTPLIGATVYIPDLKLGVITDTGGHYKFNTLPSGRSLIELHSIEFKTLTKIPPISAPLTPHFPRTADPLEPSP